MNIDGDNCKHLLNTRKKDLIVNDVSCRLKKRGLYIAEINLKFEEISGLSVGGVPTCFYYIHNNTTCEDCPMYE